MRLTGYVGELGPSIAVVGGHGRLSHLCRVEEFYSDIARWLAVGGEQPEKSFNLTGVRLAPPVPANAKVLCVGLNYSEHIAEIGFQAPQYPMIFGRYFDTLSVDGAPIPAVEEKLDWEGELAVVIGKPAFRVTESEALAHVFAYAPFNDISARTYQRHTTQYTLGKNAPGSGPIGALVTADAVGNIDAGFRLETRVNGEIVQSASTKQMIFGIARIVSYISEINMLRPGDVIATGTPSGVGLGRTPQWFLKPGDAVDVSIERVGSVSNRVTSMAEYLEWRARQ